MKIDKKRVDLRLQEFRMNRIAAIEKFNIEEKLARVDMSLYRINGILTIKDFAKKMVKDWYARNTETEHGHVMEHIATLTVEENFKVLDVPQSEKCSFDILFTVEDSNGRTMLTGLQVKAGENSQNCQNMDGYKGDVIKFNKKYKHEYDNVMCIKGSCRGTSNGFILVDGIPKHLSIKLAGQEFWKKISGGSDDFFEKVYGLVDYFFAEHEEVIDEKLNELISNVCNYLSANCSNDGVHIDPLKVLSYTSVSKLPNPALLDNALAAIENPDAFYERESLISYE